MDLKSQAIVGVFILGSLGAAAAANDDTSKTNDLQTAVERLVDQHEGDVAVAIKHLPTGAEYARRADEPMPTASLIKFPLMIAAYRDIEAGRLKLDKMITLREADKVQGSGLLGSRFSEGMQLSLRDAIHLMIVDSDNTATNLVIDQVGLEATAELMEELGCTDTKLHSKVFRRDTSIFPERSRQFGLGSTTAHDMVKLLTSLAAGELVSEQASARMLEHLYACDDATKLGKYLPEGVRLAHKTGSVSASRTDAGLIDSPEGMIAICVLTTNNADRSWSDDNDAHDLAGRIGEAAFRHFNPDHAAGPAPPKVLKNGATGLIVEGLQRTLNARLKPSHNLGVDGDFGPATQAAVTAFQKANQLPATGEVDAATWEALGPLLSEAETPEPEEVNNAPLEKQRADELAGIPFVTAKAWAIGDGDTGRLLWGHNEDASRDMASTTKTMTAYTALKLIGSDSSRLEQRIEYSAKADNTIGSTTNVRVGESVTVREALFGLMLPSGNDASVALAEHFGLPLIDDGEKGPEAAYQRFVAQMNEDARQLGMTASHFKNTHGLTEVGHHTSAADLLKLAAAAMQFDLFREIVAMPRYGCTVIGPGGYRRNVVWRNSNRLLGIEGYDGVKTGTTNAAGACLIAHGNRAGDSLFVVILGSSSSDARYADVRNLFRYAWNQRK